LSKDRRVIENVCEVAKMGELQFVTLFDRRLVRFFHQCDWNEMGDGLKARVFVRRKELGWNFYFQM